MSDIYFHPDKYGLKPVAEIDYSDGNYQFDLRVVWKRLLDDTLLTARDSGCSCPSPFESTELDQLEIMNLGDLEAEYRREVSLSYYSGASLDEWDRFYRTVKEAL